MVTDIETLKVQIYSLTGIETNDQILFVEGINGPITTTILTSRIHHQSLTTTLVSSSEMTSLNRIPIVLVVTSRSRHILSRLGGGTKQTRQDDWPFSLVESALKQQIQEAQFNGQSESINMSNRLLSSAKHMRCYEDMTMITKALDIIPIAELHQKATEVYIQQELIETRIKTIMKSYNYQLLTQLTHWFKYRFFKWANSIPCASCKSEETDSTGGAAPTRDERLIGWAGMVELYKCRKCQSITRFPRLNNPASLLDSRIGRCGEWANCFTMCCIAMGFDARHVHDWTDHVWTEVFIEQQNNEKSSEVEVRAGSVQGRWIHVDSCEAAIDTPLLYEQGWNKKLNYVIAFGLDEVVDVTRRYTQDYTVLMTRRTLANEEWLQQFLSCQDIIQRLGCRNGSGVSALRQDILVNRKSKETFELMSQGVASVNERQEEIENERNAQLIGRTTGSIEWRAARGELGTGEAAIKAIQASTTVDEKMKCNSEEKKNDRKCDPVTIEEEKEKEKENDKQPVTLSPKALLNELFVMMSIGCDMKECTNDLCKSSRQFDMTLSGLTQTQLAAKGMKMILQDKKKVEEAIGKGCGKRKE